MNFDLRASVRRYAESVPELIVDAMAVTTIQEAIDWFRSYPYDRRTLQDRTVRVLTEDERDFDNGDYQSFNLSALEIGDNGFLVLLQNNHQYEIDPAATAIFDLLKTK